MKKSLLLSTALLIGAGAIAQTNRMALPGKLCPKVRTAPVIDLTEGTSVQKAKKSVNGIQTSVLVSNSRNGYGTLNEENNIIHYNQDLNMVAITNRIPVVGTWPVTGLPTGNGVSGFMVTHYSTDNGANWAGVCYANNGTDWSRHPSGVIANAPGNTNPSLAKFVCVGPALLGGTDFKGSYFASVAADSVGNVTTNDQQTVDASPGSGTFADGSSVYFNNLISNGTTVWAAARKESMAGFVDQGASIFKGTTSGAAYTWTQDDTSFGTYMINAGGTYYCSTPKIAFSPDGMTGYVLVNGILAGATGENAAALQPNLWKSTDAGTTWNLVNANYNWRGNHPEMLCNLIPTANDSIWNTTGVNETYPAFLDAHGGGITVDNNGVLHYVTTVTPAYSSHPDSAYYIFGQYGFSYVQNDDLDKPWIYDLTTTGNGTWNQKLIGKLFTRNIEDTDVVPDPAAWTQDGTAPLEYTNRIRVSRSTDGTKIFYSWTDGDTTSIVAGPPDTYHANTYPNIEYKGYDVASGMFSLTKEMSAFDAAEGGYYNHYTSTISMPTGTGYRIPAVYISSQDGNLNLLNPIDYNYINDMEINNTEYTETIVANTNIISDQLLCVNVVGLKEVAGTSISGVSQNFPNPFTTNSTVKVNLNKSENITLNVMNNIGQVVATQTVKGNAGSNELTVDAANLSNGVYFYSVIAGNSKVTRKMTIVK
ncbi:MAG: T9SS type A sorting domain-containing protein [Bacteroidota bacterium]|nr:T9SS type A sorting domain-containing protein [Bacteroidota bacterium]